MKEMKLTKGKTAFVDDADYELLKRWKWQALKGYSTFYAIRGVWDKEKKKTINVYMHREILGIKGTERKVDHRDHNGLNNTRENLRVCSHSQNQMNRISQKGSSSKFLGVHFNKCANKFFAQIKVKDKVKYLGAFDSEIEAAKAYDIAASEHFKDFANLNFK